MSAIVMMTPGSAGPEGRVAEWHGDDQTLLVHQKEELVMPRKEEQIADLSSVTATTAGGGMVIATVGSKSVHWDMSMWLNSIIDFFGQQLVNYISGLSEKMEKLEYY